MANTPTAVFAQTPKTASAVVTAALGGITTDAPTGTVLLMTAGANGAILTRLSAIPRATLAGASLMLYISNDAGVTQRLIDSETLNTTVTTTAAIAETNFGNYSEARPLRMAAADRLYVGSQVALAGGIVFKAEWSDF